MTNEQDEKVVVSSNTEDNQPAKVATTTEEETLTEAVETDEDIADFQDGSDDDSSSEQEVNADTEKKKQTRAENRKYAELRKQRLAKEHEEQINASYKKGLVDSIDGINPFTKEKIEDDLDIEIYQNMREIEKRGGDPIEDYHKYMKVFKKEAQAKIEEETRAQKETQTKVLDDVKLFNKNYPDVDVSKVLQDQDFKDFALESINRGEPLSSAYNRFIKYQAKFQSNAEEKARKIVAKNLSSPGSLTSTGETKQKSFKEMTDEEFTSYQKAHGLS